MLRAGFSAHQRHCLPSGGTVLKRVMAVSAEHVCIVGRAIWLADVPRQAAETRFFKGRVCPFGMRVGSFQRTRLIPAECRRVGLV